LEFNTFPTIAIAGLINYGHLSDLSDTTIRLEGATSDPDGDPIMSTLWTHDCTYAFIASDPTSLNAVVIPVEAEVCTASLTSCDSRGCNMAQMTMDINCTTLGNGFDPLAAGAEPINDCFLAAMCDPLTVPPHPTDDCVTNGWECGTGLDGCPTPGIVSCGTCDPTVTPGQNGSECQPDQSCLDCTYDEVAACVGIGCGNVDVLDACGNTVSVACPDTCDGVTNTCDYPNSNDCRPFTIWRCDAVNYGANACVDYLETDGWNAVEAERNCQISSPDQPGVLTEVLEPASCKDSYVAPPPGAKRCVATWEATSTPSYATPYYVYVPDYFPDQVCANNLGGVVDAAPWPAY
jgi:hypothetical protein